MYFLCQRHSYLEIAQFVSYELYYYLGLPKLLFFASFLLHCKSCRIFTCSAAELHIFTFSVVALNY